MAFQLVKIRRQAELIGTSKVKLYIVSFLASHCRSSDI